MNATSNTHQSATSRREFIKNTGRLAAASALTGTSLPHVHAAENNTLQLALIGCGGRGTGAAADALAVKNGPIKLVAMADTFESRLKSSIQSLRDKFSRQVEVPADRQFVGFEGYQKAMDCLKPGDVAIFATPPAFRWVHFTYAIQKGLHVFMEKPVTVDGPTSRRMFQLAKDADAKNLKVGVGLMVRHCRARQELKQRIDDGQIGDLLLMRGYRMSGPGGFTGPNPGKLDELHYQIQRFHSFLWASGGIFSDYFIHQIDECSWMKGAWPVSVQATGGRHFRGDAIDQNFDNYSAEYTYPDGAKLIYFGRQMSGCHNEFASYAHGTKGLGIISTSAHTPGVCRIYNGQSASAKDLAWKYPQPEQNPYQLEWDDLIDAIRNDKPYNEVERGVQASLVTSMGRMAAHTGQVIQYADILKSDHEFAPGIDQLTETSPAPLLAGADGKYPVPLPGKNKDREY
jgi:hypothetical protein